MLDSWKLWVVFACLLVAPACSSGRQGRREGDTSNRFSEHRWEDRPRETDPHVGRTNHHARGEGDEDDWVSGVLGGIWDFFFDADTSDSQDD